jgi:anti-anti-sigma factor
MVRRALESADAEHPFMSGSPFLTVRKLGDAQVVALLRADMTDGAFIKQAGDEIYHLVKPIEQPKVVIDFGKVQRLSSATLGMLVALHRVVVDRQKGQLRVSNVAEHLREIFRMTQLDDVLNLHETTEAAVESFR